MTTTWRGLAALAILAAALVIVIYPRIVGSTQPRTADLPPADAAATQAPVTSNQPTAVVATPTPDPAQERQKRIADLEVKILESPDDAAVSAELGKLYFEEKVYARAADLFATSLEVEADNAEVRAQFASALLYQGMLGMAKREFKRAIALNASLPEPHFNLGVILSHTNPQDIPGALEYWRETIRLAPESELARMSEQYIASYAAQDATATPETGAVAQESTVAPSP